MKDLQKRRVPVGILFVLWLSVVGWSKAEAQAPTGAIAGLFSVSDSTQVYFSQGNLQYQASTNTWRFATNQYDYVGADNANASSSYTGWIDLFAWGTSGYNHGANVYQPWNNSDNYYDFYAYGAYTNNLYDGNGQADWGYNAISNGGNTENSGWRTLTQPEWNYVFNTRSTASGIRWAKGTVNGINGIILLPDNWTASVYTLNNTNGGDYSSNTVTAEDWANTLEVNGVVFLPAAGCRNQSWISDVGSNGYYSSSSYNDSRYRYSMFFGNVWFNTGSYGYRHYGVSVRLVRSAENTSHTYIDLGLPSGTLWATCNVGADTPEEYGDYFAWGETQPKDTYNWSTYQYCNGSENTLTKYCNNADYGYNGFTDDLTTLLPEDDAATASWGNEWRMPTMDDFEELYNNTTVIWTTQNGVNGRLFTASNGNSLFLPAAGYRQGSGLYNVGSDGNCWTCELRTDSPDYAWRFYFGSNGWNMYYYVNRDYGFPVRPVRSNSQLSSYTINATANPTDGGTVSGGGTYAEGATCTLTATPAAGYTFINWTENGEEVSTETEYSFTVTGDRDLVANFTLENVNGHNLVFNGDFELGNTGFSTDYIYGNTGSYNHYYIGHDYAEMWPWDSPGFPVVDHTSGEGLYMMVDGALQDNSLVWSQTVTVTPNTDYVFSAWFLTNNAGYVRFEINDVSGPDFTTPADSWVWEQQSMTWNSGNNTEATLKIINRYAQSGGYDYCIDDIFFGPIHTIPTEGLIAYYPFNGDANDYSGNEYHATPCNNYQYEDGMFGEAIAVVGEGGWTSSSGGHVLLPQYEADFSTGITLSLWVKSLGFTYSHGEVYIGFGNDTWDNGSDPGRIWILQNPGVGNISFYYQDSAITIPYNEEYTGNWVMYSLTCGQDGKLSAYVNGVKVGEENVEYNGQINTTLAALGRHWWNEGGYSSTRFIGSFDEVRIYNRALSSEEVQVLYENNIYEITANANPVEGGTISGTGTYNFGDTCTLTATPNLSYTFINWTENGEVVSTENPYTFTVTSDRELVANFMHVLPSLSDDFNDGVIDPELWIATGNNVYEEEGLLKMDQNITDQNVSLLSVPMSVGSDNKIVVERKFFLHKSNQYYYGGFSFEFNGDTGVHGAQMRVNSFDNTIPNNSGVDHISIVYCHTDWEGKYGIYVQAGVGSEIQGTRICDAVFETWLTEKVVVDLTAGTLSYYLDDAFIATVDIPELSALQVNYFTTIYWPWGYWTGHQHYMDYVNINPLSEGLIAYYPFDGDANDYSGNEYHATPYNNYQYEDGLVGESIAVEGQGYMESSGGHVMLPQYDFDASSGITLSLWVNALGLTSSDGEAYINLGDHTNADGLYILQNTNTVYFQYHNSYVAVPYLEDYTGNWVMYTMTCGSDGKLKAYINGAFVGEEDVEYNGQINTSLAALGRHWWYNNGATSTRFTGSFDEVRIYGRALTPEEVQMLYGNNVIEITATANPEEGGTVSGAGQYSHGDTCTLIATPNASYTFINWTENDEVVSTEATYSFTVTGNRELVANFEGSTLNPEEDLVAYYPFDGDVNDYSGNDNHGTIIGNVVPATDRHGNVNGAYRFPGEAFNYISVPDAECLHLSNFTLSAWVYTDADNYGSGYLINKGRDINNGSYHLTVSGVSAFNDYYGENGAGVSENPQTHEWHMITGTVEGDQARYYLDGVLMDERTLSNPFSYSNSEPLTLGCHYYSGVPSYWAYTLLGVLDEVRIYSRVFTPQEVMQLYNYSEGSLSGIFSVSETTQVNFSKGNLQYQASTNTWRFAENQWDCIGADNANISETYDGWIDLFGWGTSGYDHGANAYQPWSTSQNNYDYLAYGDSGASLSDYTGQADWGYNAISNGGNQEGLWHTLSHSEWDYLINNRPGTTLNGVENARHAKAVVNGIAGLILFPDHYAHPEGIALPVNINAYSSLFTDNEYTMEQWYEMEAAGAVFLPTAGIRSGGVPTVGSLGIYWSTTPSSGSYAHRFDFTTDYVVAWGIDSKWYGYSVRLVKNVLTTTCSIEATPNPIEGGTVTGAGTYFVSETCTLTAIPNEGYTFMNWTENDEVVSTDATYSFTVTTERNLVANFALPFTITASATPEEGGTVSGAGEYDYGTECTLVATPNEDYSFMNWTKGENVVSTQASYSFVVTEDADYVAHFSLKVVGTVTAEYDPDPNDNQSPYVRVSWSRDSNMQENFESGDFNMHAWEFPDSYPWVITDNNPYEGTFCMRSNNGGAHYTSSTVQMTMFIPSEGQMSFYSRISSEGNYDYGRFYIDDQQLGAWSGNGGWEQHIYDITAGQHTFKWAYTKDGSVNSNDDCFYVDNINFFGVTRDGTRAVHHYEVYRTEYSENGSWELIADDVSDTTYVDMDWSALAEGWYQYGVAAYYEGFDTVYPTYMARSNSILRAYPHTITATANPEEGGTITGAGDYVLYTECTLTATANENYTFVNWTENGQEVTTEATYSFTVTTERDLVANFLLPLTITASANPEEGGTITGAGEYDYNSECTLTAIPDEDYYFVNWTENGTVVSRNAIYSFTVTTERDLVAHFEFKPVGLVTAVYDPDPEDNQSPYVRVNWNMDFNLREDFESGDFSQHEWETNWVISNNSYEGDYCMSSSNHGNNSSSYAQVTVNIPNDRQMSFWSRISSESSYDYGRFYIDDQQLGAWSGNGGWEQHTYDVSAGEHTFKWEYTKDVSLSHNDDCFYVDYIDFVSGARGDRAVDHYQVYRSVHPENGSWELLADNLTDTTYVDTDWSALAEGWYKYGVVANYAGIDTLYTTSMVRSNRILRAYPHTITATANPEEGGTITGAGEHIYNSECTLIATPNENYTFVNWTENGQEVSTDATYSFTVTTERDLVANFVLPFTITVSVVPDEGGTVTGAGEYVIGTECTLIAIANEGYQFMYWTENGAMVSSDDTYSFTVTADHTMVAYFAENTQTISLSTGWTWISTYIEQGDVDGLAMLEEGMNPNGVMIKSQNDGFLSYDADMWIGTLDAIVNEKMYLVNVTAPSEVVMTGPIAHLADHPITLNPNWTWLGYPSPFEMDVNDALANLNATEGDMLKSQSSFSTYSTEYGWFGALNTLTPGMGLMYQSHNSQAITLTYSVGMSRSLRANVTVDNNHWVPDIHAYPNNMSIMAVVELNDEELQEERYELAVFSGDECRGSARLVYVEAMRRYVAFLSVSGDEDAELCLALYDSATGEAYFNTSDCLSFEANAVLGSLHSPFVARFGGNTELDEFGGDAVILYPNPVSKGHLFQLELPAESKGARVSIINALGSVVSTTDLYAKPATLRAPDVPGVYTVRVVTSKQGTYCRKLIVK